MPGSTHLEWADIADFTPGYFSVGEWLMPSNGSQEMKDCRPDPGGGLRASIKPTSFSTSGLPSTSKVVGIFSRGGITIQAGIADASDRYIAVYDSADNKVKIYRWNETLTSAPTSWTLIKSHAAPASTATPNPVIFDTFVDSTFAAHVVWTLAHVSSEDGLWSLQFSYQAGQGASANDDIPSGAATYSVTQRKAGFCTGVAVQDDRLITAIGGRVSTLWWNASQNITSWPAANNLPVQASRQGSTVMGIAAFAPGDLLIGTRFSAWTMIQGAITDPIVRTMSDARPITHIQKMPFTTNGLSFISQKVGVCLTGNGEQFTDLSKQIDPSTWVNNSNCGDVGAGDTVYVGDWLFAAHGLIYDDRTQGWHRSSVLTGSKDHFHSWADLSYRQVFAATGGTSFSLYVFDVSSTSRWNTYTWKSASFHHPTGRQIRIREIQVFCKTYDSSSTVAVTVNGSTFTQSPSSAGRQQLDFYLDEVGEVLDVQVVPTSGSSGVEAPSIEVVRVGTRSQHQLR